MVDVRQSVANSLFQDSGRSSQSVLVEAVLVAVIVFNIGIELYYSYIKVEVPGFFKLLFLVSGIVYALEIIMRLWACVELDKYKSMEWPRLVYGFHPLIILDLIAVVPIVVSGGAVNTSFFRIFRIFELGGYFSFRNVSPFILVKNSILHRAPEIAIIIFTLISLVIFSAFLFNLIENYDSSISSSFYSSFPSAELIIEMLLGSETLISDGISKSGQFILSATQVMGWFLIGLPSAFVTGSFVSELQAANEMKRIIKVENVLRRSFDVINPIPVREYLKLNGITARARERTLDELQYRLGLAIDDVKKIGLLLRTVKLRAVDDPVSKQSRIIVEEVDFNRIYGVCKDRSYERLLVCTQSPGEPSLGHFAETISKNISSSLVTNQFFSSGELKYELRQNFSKSSYYGDRSSIVSPEIREFAGDIERLIFRNPQIDIAYITAMGARHVENIRIRAYGVDSAVIHDFVMQNKDARLEQWDESQTAILGMVEALEPNRILKIELSTRILRTSDHQQYFDYVVKIRDLLEKIFD